MLVGSKNVSELFFRPERRLFEEEQFGHFDTLAGKPNEWFPFRPFTGVSASYKNSTRPTISSDVSTS